MSNRQVEMVAIEELRGYENNPRTHPSAQVEKIAKSIAEFGWTTPILIDAEGEVIAGHGRLLAARHLGFAKVPVIRLADLTPAQARAYRIADNQLTLLGEWEEELLSGELLTLAEEGFDLGLLGFGEEELERLLGDFEGGEEAVSEEEVRKTLAEKFGLPPFSVLNAREGWWQARKRAWIGLGIKSEEGRGEGFTPGNSPEVTEAGLNYYRKRERGKRANATPGGSPLPAADYSKRERGDGRGRGMGKGRG